MPTEIKSDGSIDIKKVSLYLSMTEEQAQDVCDLFDKLKAENSILVKHFEFTRDTDYIDCWEQNWYRAMNFDELVQSEIEQGGWDSPVETIPQRAREFCETEMNNTIFKLPCGMIAQYV